MSTAAFVPVVDKENIAPQSQTQAANLAEAQFSNGKRARRHRAGHRKQMAILKSQQMNENMELESLKTQQALQNAEIAIQGAELQQLQSAAETAQAYVDKLQDTQAVELDAIRQLQQEQDEEREEIARLNDAQEHQHGEIVNAERLLRMAQQKQSQELRRLRSESTEEREQMESLRQQQEALEAKADELITAQGDERADIVLLKAQTDVHRERLVSHEVTLRELVMKQEACNELTEKELGDLQAESELDRAQIDRLLRRQQEEGGRLTDVQALLSVQEARLATDEHRMDALSEMTQQMRSRHIEDLTLLQQSQAVEHQERLQQEAALQSAQIELASNIRRLEKLREKEEPRIRLMERRQSLEEAEMSVLRERQEQHEKDLAGERERAQSEETALTTATRAEVVRLNREVLALRNQVVDRNRDIDRVITDFENIRQEHVENVSFLAVDRTKKLRELADKQTIIDELLNKAEWLQMQYAADCALNKVMEREKDRAELANIRDQQNRELDSALEDARGLLMRGQAFADEEAQDQEFVEALVEAAVEAAAEDQILASVIAEQIEEQLEQDFAERQLVDALVEAVEEVEAQLDEEEQAEEFAEKLVAIAEEIAEGIAEDSMEDAAIINRMIQLGDQNDQVALILRETDETEIIDAETGEVIGTSVLDRTEIQPLAAEGHVITTTEKRFTFITEDEEGRRIINEVVEREEYEEFDEDEEEQEGLLEEDLTSPAPIVLDIVEVSPQPQDELERILNLTESEILDSNAVEAPRRVAPSREFFPDVPRRRTDIYNADTTLLALPSTLPAQTQFFQQPQSFATGGRALPQTWMGLSARPQESFGNRAFGWNQGAQLSQNQGLSGYFTNANTNVTPAYFSSSWMNPLSSGATNLSNAGSATNLFGAPNLSNNTISFMGSTVPLTMPSHMGVQSSRSAF